MWELQAAQKHPCGAESGMVRCCMGVEVEMEVRGVEEVGSIAGGRAIAGLKRC